MPSLATMRNILLTYLVTTADDPLYTPTVLNQVLADAYNGLIAEIHSRNRGYLYKDVLLTPDATTTQPWSTQPVESYTLATQSPAITDYAYWIELRKTNDDGDLLKECRLEDLRDAGNGFFAVAGPDDSPVIRLSKDTELGLNLYLKYGYWPAQLAQDTDVPSAIPLRYQDVVPLEACFAFGLGGESAFPPDLRQRWVDRRAMLMARISRQGTWPGRTKVDPFDVEVAF